MARMSLGVIVEAGGQRAICDGIRYGRIELLALHLIGRGTFDVYRGVHDPTADQIMRLDWGKITNSQVSDFNPTRV